VTSARGVGDPQTFPNFRLWQKAIPIHNVLHGASDLDQRCLKTRNSEDGCTFPPNIFAPTPKITPKPHFVGSFNAKPIIQRALRQSHGNGATTLKLYGYIGIGTYLGVCRNFSDKGRLGYAGPLNVNLGLRDIWETTTARKLNLKIPLDMVKYPHWIQKLLHYTTQHDDGRHINFRQMSISPGQTTRLTTARRLSAYISSRALATTTTSSYYYYYYLK